MSCCFKLIMLSGIRKKLLDDEKNIKELLYLVKAAVANDTESTVEQPFRKKNRALIVALYLNIHTIAKKACLS